MFSDARKFLLYSAELLFLSMHCVYLFKRLSMEKILVSSVL